MTGYRRLPWREGETMPAHRPYYPPLPATYRDAEFQMIYFRAEPAVIQAHLPQPLIADPDGVVMAFSLHAPFCSAYGPYKELGLRLRCSLDGRMGFYSSHQYVDNVAALCAGRERWGGPKEYAEVHIERAGPLVHAWAVQEGVRIMALTSDVSQPAEPGELIFGGPSYRLKLIPRADGPGPAIKQIITYAGQDVELKLLRKGSGMIELHSTAHSDLSPFQPIEVVNAFFQVMSLTEGYGQIVYDYLA
jgi:acetoacetate decarboxylase